MPFITNNNTSEDLRSRIIELLERSNELKFLVGFFYFSGIRELYSTLKEKEGDFVFKILVGLNVDRTIAGIAAEYGESEEQSRRDVENAYFDSIKKSLNSDTLDSKATFEQIHFFINLVQEGKLILRKTRKPNHSKLYIFELEDRTIAPNLFITGSSNLTSAGLSTQSEFNIEIKDYGVDKANEFFEELWNEAVKITEDDALRQKLIDTIENETLIKKISPFEAFALILKTYLETREGVDISETLREILKKNGYKAYKYQEDAVRQAVKIINTYDGAIVADVVGLGKSIVASMIAKELGKRGIILCPPGLIKQWKQYTEEFELHSWEVISSGNLDAATEFVKNAHGSIEAVVIDEAHRFRNDDTQSYRALKNLCREKKVLLLTATPFNNSPADILSLLELFTIPRKSPITLDGNVRGRFQAFNVIFEKLSEIKKYYKSTDPEKRRRAETRYFELFEEKEIDIRKVAARAGDLAMNIRSLIEPVVIRRNRLDLKNHPDYSKEVTDLSEIASPEPWFYELSPEQSDFYDQILEEYFGEDGQFTGAVYKPFIYESGKDPDTLDIEENRVYQSERNTSDFMRRLLVKRLESSFGSFSRSIDNFIAITSKILKFVEKNDQYVLDRKLIEKIYEYDEEDVEKELAKFAEKLEASELPRDKKMFDVSAFKQKDKFIADIKSDLALFEHIKEQLIELDFVATDPKATSLIEQIKQLQQEPPAPGEPKRKIIIFTEYRDTANHLEPILRAAFGDSLLFSGEMGMETIKLIESNFDAALPESKQEDTYQILLATDRVSEGFNLNRAGMVINYDIPWNPVRVIQRVGRINRISKKVFETLRIVNFFPTERGAAQVDIETIAANKMFMIHNILGEDAKIFHEDEEPQAATLYQRLLQDPDEEEESFETKVVNAFRTIREEHPDLVASLDEFPTRIKVAKGHDQKSLLVFSRRERLHIQQVLKTEEQKLQAQELPLEQVFGQIECPSETPAKPLSEQFWDQYTYAKHNITTSTASPNVQSMESKSMNLLQTYSSHQLRTLQDCAQVLLEDLRDYGTLTLPTMRDIVQTEKLDDEGIEQELQRIVEEQGGIDYLSRIKAKIKESRREIVIAVENQ
jgi:superfamily II DNA or RNA helicase/HKD family nuclease